MSAFLTWDVALMNLFSDMTCRRCRSHPINEAVMLMTRQRSTTIAWQREEQRQQCWDKQHGFGLAVMRNPVRGTQLCWPVSKRHPLKSCVDQPSPSTVSSWAHSEFTPSVTLKLGRCCMRSASGTYQFVKHGDRLMHDVAKCLNHT